MLHKKRLLGMLVAVFILVMSASSVLNAQDKSIIIGLITKTETNPFFVKMREGAQAKADALGATLLTAAGAFDGDNEAQVTAIENMVNAGAKGILITPSDTSAIVPAIKKARDAGVIVIALDTPTDPQDATDALFATDNLQAGVLIGQYARAKMGDKPVKIAMLDLAPGITVGQLRHDGFLQGYGIKQDDAQIVCQQDTQGDQSKGQTAMENCLTIDPEINLVYTINEPAAFGAYTAIDNAGRAKDVTIVSVDGGCAGVEGVVGGKIAATSQQYPLRMASLGVETIVKYAQTGEKPTGYTDTGVTLITNDATYGGGEGVVFGVNSCWGEPGKTALADAQTAQTASTKAAIATMKEPLTLGLITKTETNPFFVKMREGAQAKATELGITLLTAAGAFDGDNEAQVTAIENMVNAGAKGILITPSDTSAIVPAIKKARDAGVVVIALDTPTDPQDATDALFATDNFQAGVLIGQYARAVNGDKPVKIAMLDLAPGITVGQLRHDGFLQGFGITQDDAQIVCQQDTQGDQSKGQTAMENCLTIDPEINLVYTINEPAAFGAYTAIDNAGRAKDVTIVSVDGGCAGVEGVVEGKIAATSQQYPLRMASLGVEAITKYALTGVKPAGYTDTGVTLITNNTQDGLSSIDSKAGLEICWGGK